jgi:hypothetical protein
MILTARNMPLTWSNLVGGTGIEPVASSVQGRQGGWRTIAVPSLGVAFTCGFARWASAVAVQVLLSLALDLALWTSLLPEAAWAAALSADSSFEAG